MRSMELPPYIVLAYGPTFSCPDPGRATNCLNRPRVWWRPSRTVGRQGGIVEMPVLEARSSVAQPDEVLPKSGLLDPGKVPLLGDLTSRQDRTDARYT